MKDQSGNEIDFSHQAYRGFDIRFNALEGQLTIEKEGKPICKVPPDQSWFWARAMVDELIDEIPNDDAPMPKMQAYKAGLWYCPAPPVCTALWDDASWIKYIDRDGHWTVPVV
jgi:hypothetical protein